jgi:hypothetical protein
MSRRRALLALLACLAVTGAPAAAAAAGSPPRTPPSVVVSLDRSGQAERLGASFAFGSTIANVGRTPLAGLVAHLNVVSLTPGVYVDPEDWSSERTKYLPAVAPGRSLRVPWKVTAVNGGRFAVYVVAIPRRLAGTTSAGLAIGRPMTLRVAERRVFNSGGVLFLTLGVPALLALSMAAVRAVRRRPRPSARAAGALEEDLGRPG